MQHPLDVAFDSRMMKPMSQFYFDVGDKTGTMNQIIVTYPDGMAIPTEHGRKIELKGTATAISLGGKPKTKGSYSNEVLALESWRYLAPQYPQLFRRLDEKAKPVYSDEEAEVFLQKMKQQLTNAVSGKIERPASLEAALSQYGIDTARLGYPEMRPGNATDWVDYPLSTNYVLTAVYRIPWGFEGIYISKRSNPK